MACEKCWGDAYVRYLMWPHKTQAEHYRDLLKEREENWCTPEEQRGETTTETRGIDEDDYVW